MAAIASAALALASVVVALPAMNYDFSAAAQPLSFLQKGGAGVARVLRWSLLLDMLGYYLLDRPAGDGA